MKYNRSGDSYNGDITPKDREAIRQHIKQAGGILWPTLVAEMYGIGLETARRIIASVSVPRA